MLARLLVCYLLHSLKYRALPLLDERMTEKTQESLAVGPCGQWLIRLMLC